MRLMSLAALAVFALAPPPALAEDLAAKVAAVRDKALVDPVAWDFVESLTTEVGPRPTGSPAMTRARDWAVAKLTALGFRNVHVEAFEAEAWRRGAESAEVISPYPQKLAILGLGGSVPTPKSGLEGEVALFSSLKAMMEAPAGSLKGKIVVVNQPMGRNQDASGYGANTAVRMQGPSEAARRGAIAYLLRSLSTDDTRLPHTGRLNRAPDAPEIPAAALSVPDAELLARMAARGAPVRIRLKMDSSDVRKAPAWNVVGEMPGAERPDEVILVGGHLDSWDPGTGAIDDGAGMAITTAAARLVGEGRPRRTIRVVLWGAEEMDESGEAYGLAHAGEVGRMVVVGESDTGPGPVWRARLPKGALAHPAMQAFAAAVIPLRVVVGPEPALGSGSDTVDLVKAGAPAVMLSPDATRYFDLHHSADDTLDKIDPKDLAQSVAVWASFLQAAADSDIDFRALATQP